MYFTYIIYSDRIDKYYTGYTHNLALRIERHNNGWGNFSSKGIPWKLVYSEKFSRKTDAIKRENQIKKMKSRKYIEDLIKNA
jgi:putative endonuclease